MRVEPGQGQRPQRGGLFSVIVVAAALGLLAGCGSSSSSQAVTTSSVQSTVQSTSQAASTTQAASSSLPGTASAAGDDCGGAVARVTKAVAGFPQVSKIVMIAACGTASIETNMPAGVLGSDSATTGLKICTAAAAVAYQGKVGSVTVDAADGSELAIGLKGADCIP